MTTISSKVHLIKRMERPATTRTSTELVDGNDESYNPTFEKHVGVAPIGHVDRALVGSKNITSSTLTGPCSASLIFDSPTLFPNSLLNSSKLALCNDKTSIWSAATSTIGWGTGGSSQQVPRSQARRMALANAPQSRVAMPNIDQMAKVSRPKTIRSFNARLNSFAQKGSYYDVLALIEGVQNGQIEIGGELNTYSYTILLKAYCNAGNLASAKALLKKMETFEAIQRPNRFTYNTLLNACVKWDAMESASELFAIMESSDDPELNPDHVSFTTMMKGFAVSGDMVSAQNLLDRLMNHRDVTFRPNQVTYNTMLKGYAASGDMAGADRLLEIMCEQSCMPDIVSLNTIIGGHARKGDMDKAEMHLASMQSANLHPNAVTYHAIIEGYIRTDNIDAAEKVFDLIESLGIRDPSATPLTYQTMIIGLIRIGELAKAETLYKKQLFLAETPTQVTHTMMISAFSTAGKMDSAEAALAHVNAVSGCKETSIHATSAMYDSLISGYCNLGHTNQAMSIIEEMQRHPDRNCHPTRNSFHVLLAGYVKAGQLDLANDLYHFMATYPDPACRPNHTTHHICNPNINNGA